MDLYLIFKYKAVHRGGVLMELSDVFTYKQLEVMYWGNEYVMETFRFHPKLIIKLLRVAGFYRKRIHFLFLS